MKKRRRKRRKKRPFQTSMFDNLAAVVFHNSYNFFQEKISQICNV